MLQISTRLATVVLIGTTIGCLEDLGPTVGGEEPIDTLITVSDPLTVELGTEAYCPAMGRRGWDGSQVLQLLEPFQHYDINDDGLEEIQLLWPLYTPRVSPSANPNYVLILLDSRLMHRYRGGATDDLGRSYTDDDLFQWNDDLRQYAHDLEAEGYSPYILYTDVYGQESPAREPVAQNGLTMLAMRRAIQRFYRCANDTPGELVGVTLVGSFPEARTYVHTPRYTEDSCEDLCDSGFCPLRCGTEPGDEDVPLLEVRTRVLSNSSDIVLADMDGNWEDVYVQSEERHRVRVALSQSDIGVADREQSPYGRRVRATDLHTSSQTLLDGFLTGDTRVKRYSSSYASLSADVHLDPMAQSEELSAADLAEGRQMAFPELYISRIDARGVARQPDAGSLVDDSGSPIPGYAASGENPANRQFVYDPVFELHLLAQYFDRNHGYRVGEITMNRESSSIAADDFNSLREANRFDALVPASSRSNLGHASLADAVMWVADENPLFKSVIAHTSPRSSNFSSEYSPHFFWRLMRNYTGQPYVYDWAESGLPGYWAPQRHFETRSGKLTGYFDHRILYTVYQATRDDNEHGFFYFHGGCNANSPIKTELIAQSFNHDDFGRSRPSADLLFLGRGLVSYARAKVYNTFITDQADALAVDGAVAGDVITEVFNDLDDSFSYGDSRLPRKQGYFWGIQGDWSLQALY